MTILFNAGDILSDLDINSNFATSSLSDSEHSKKKLFQHFRYFVDSLSASSSLSERTMRIKPAQVGLVESMVLSTADGSGLVNSDIEIQIDAVVIIPSGEVDSNRLFGGNPLKYTVPASGSTGDLDLVAAFGLGNFSFLPGFVYRVTMSTLGTPAVDFAELSIVLQSNRSKT